MVKCEHCNAENEEKATICQNCGEEIRKKGINKIFLIGIGIFGFLVLIIAISSLINTPWIAEFDQELINSVKSGESSESLISKIKEHSKANREGSKKGYENIVSGGKSESNPEFLDEAKENYHKELDYIQKIENLQLSFAKREINEETFIKKLSILYQEQPELDY
ncbi:MAG TPA: hypothetical protein PL168_02330 [Methanobacterium sp.]|jgi:hypothetical protein|nr:hypothetical protein [Methanobacterium sp.]HOI39543.1 hypothetical protein [Methanobacterium sp.]